MNNNDEQLDTVIWLGNFSKVEIVEDDKPIRGRRARIIDWSDTSGLSDEEMDEIFKPFLRSDI